jgi:glycine cleavage system aminomethyltransferase T
VIGMAWVPAELAHDSAEFFVTMNGGFDKAHVRLRPFFDPGGERLRS